MAKAKNLEFFALSAKSDSNFHELLKANITADQFEDNYKLLKERAQHLKIPLNEICDSEGCNLLHYAVAMNESSMFSQ